MDWKRFSEFTGEPFPGFIWAYQFHADGSGRKLDPQGIEAALAAHDGWVWLHLNLASVRALEWLDAEAPICKEARAVFSQIEEYPNLQATGDGTIFGIFADLKQEFNEKKGDDLAKFRFCISDGLFLSARRTPLRSVEETRAAIDEGTRFPSAFKLLEALVLHFCNGVAKTARGLSTTLDRIEDRVVFDEPDDESLSLGPLRRTALRLHRQLQHMAILFHDFSEEHDEALPEETRLAAARIERRLKALDNDIQDLHDRARVIGDEMSAKLAQQANRNLSVLSLVTALFVPPTLVTGVWGMNLALPWKEDPDGLIIVLGICVLSTFSVLLVWRLMTTRH